MKISNKILLSLALLVLVLPLFYAFLLKPYVVPVEQTQISNLAQKTEVIQHSVNVDTFQYIHVEGAAVKIDTGDWQVRLKTKEEWIDQYSFKVRQDTLFISKTKPFNMYSNWGEVAINVPELMGVGVSNQGMIRCENTGADFGANHFVIWAGTGVIDLPVHGGTLDMYCMDWGSVYLKGKLSRLNIHGTGTGGSLSGFQLETDTAYVKGLILGDQQLYVKDYLHADLRGSFGSVSYRGNPEVVKKENAKGRLINVNRRTR